MLAGLVIVFLGFVGHGIFDGAYQASVEEYQASQR